MKKTIAVIFGGCSPEYPVSLESSYSVIKAINQDKYNLILIGITKEGNWYRFNGSIEKIKDNTWYKEKSCHEVFISPSRKDHGLIEIIDSTYKKIWLDAVFPILHGKNGEDGTLQGLIELAGLPLIGCKTLSSSICMDKYISHKLVEIEGVKTAKSILIDHSTGEKELIKMLGSLKFPLFVKPCCAGSSFGINKVQKFDELLPAITTAMKYDSKVIIEETIEGIEIGCAILGTEKLTVGALDEIEISTSLFDYNEKYTLKTSKIHVPARIDENIQNKIKSTALKIYSILKCQDFARVDLFLTKDNEIYFNEVNTIPGFTSHSRYPSMMKEAGLSFNELIATLIELEVNNREK